MKLWHDVEVHTVDARNQCWRHENDRDDGKYLDDFVLLDVNQTEERVLEILQPLKREVRVFKHGVNVLDDDAELFVGLAGELRAFKHRGNHALLVNDVFAEHHRRFLKAGNAQEELCVGLLGDAQGFSNEGDLAGDILNKVGVSVNARFEKIHEDGETIGVLPREDFKATLDFKKGP